MSELLSEALQTAVATQSEYRLASIFELLAQENLRYSVRPAFEYLTKVIANHRPQTFAWVLRHFDELFTLAELAVQHHFLSFHIASYAELYYGLRRKVKGLKVESHQYLGTRRHLLSLVTLCILPYLSIKLKKLHEAMIKRQDSPDNADQYPKRLLLWAYPVGFTLWEMLRLHCQFQYAIHQNKYFDPFLKLFRIKLVIENPTVSEASSNLASRIFSRMISGGVHAGVFLLQFIEWCYGDGSQPVKQIVSTRIPDAPDIVNENKLPRTTCPLCRRMRTNDTALSVSGYVFCYTCIYKYIKSHSRCPITGFPSQTKHLVKLYLPE